MRVLITGATGFAGLHLVRRLLADGETITAVTRSVEDGMVLPDSPQLTRVEADLLDVASLRTAVSVAQPDVIYHLAGQASPGRSWEIPGETLAVNSVGTANLLDVAVQYGRPRVIIVTSADVYGTLSPEALPITEATLPQPRHPYGVSKWAAAQLVPLYWQRFNLPVIEARPFNHIGPGQALGFVVPDFASQLAAIKLKQREARLAVGNLAAQRDFTDVRDVAAGYVALAQQGRPGETYLICSGEPVAINDLLTILLELVGTAVTIEQDAARMRPSDTPCLMGSYAKLQADTGWQPRIPLRQSLADALADWMQRLSDQPA